MVKIIKISLLVGVISLLSLSCSNNQMGFDKDKWRDLDMEGFAYHSWMLLSAYTSTYDKSPENANDLLIFIERQDSSSRQFYNSHYEYFNENRHKLIFRTEVEDSTSYVAIYYKKVNPKNLLIRAPYESPFVHMDFSSRINFFDKNGYYLMNDSLQHDVWKRMIDISADFKVNLMPSDDIDRYGVKYVRKTLEHTPNALSDLSAKRSIDYQQSPFFTQIYEYLDSIAVANDYSRIIVPSFVDKDIKYKN